MRAIVKWPLFRFSDTLRYLWKPGSNVLPGALRTEFHAAGPASHVEIPVRVLLGALPLQEHGLWAALAAYEAHRFPINHLRLRIDAGPRAVAG